MTLVPLTKKLIFKHVLPEKEGMDIDEAIKNTEKLMRNRRVKKKVEKKNQRKEKKVDKDKDDSDNGKKMKVNFFRLFKGFVECVQWRRG